MVSFAMGRRRPSSAGEQHNTGRAQSFYVDLADVTWDVADVLEP